MAKQLLAEQNSYAERISKAYENFANDTEANVFTCKTRLESLNSLWVHYEENHYKILAGQNSDKLAYIKNNTFNSVEEKYLQTKGQFVAYIGTHNDPSVHNNTRSIQNANYEVTERLERISIPKFNGDYTKWENFRDMFQSLVLNRNMSDVAKLHFLKSKLENEALQLIASVPTTDLSFDDVWKTVVEKYENKRRLVSSHISAFYSLKVMKKESAWELKRILNGIKNPLQALKTLGRTVDNWDDLIVFHTVSLFEQETRKQWEKFLGTLPSPKDPPTVSDLTKFIENQIIVLESIEDSNKRFNGNGSSSSTYSKNSSNNRTSAMVVNNENKTSHSKCLICESGDHFFSFCDTYNKWSVPERKNFVVNKHRCFNCLGAHLATDCKSDKRCKICKNKHHFTLHIQPSSGNNGSNSQNKNSQSRVTHVANQFSGDNNLDHFSQERDGSDSVDNTTFVNTCSFANSVLLSTAVVKVFSSDVNFILVRALIDQCSQSSFISEYACQQLGLKRKAIELPVSGVGGKKSCVCKSFVNIGISSIYDSKVIKLNALVLSRVSNYNPNVNSEVKIDYLNDIQLADPEFLKNRRVDLLLGSSIYSKIVEGSVIKGGDNRPIAQKTSLGWIVSGDTPSSKEVQGISVFHIAEDQKIDHLLENFWNQEEFVHAKHLTKEELECEELYRTTHSRSSDGRFIVRLPIKVGEHDLTFPGSFGVAEKMLKSLERKFIKNPKLKIMNCDFFKDYLEKGHMREASDLEVKKCRYLIPHFGILREDHLTTKFRSVFNGSAKALNGSSINQVCYTGENLLQDLASLILGWRKYKFVFVSDIKQMFRQIRVHIDDQIYQAILWRFDESDPIKVYFLETVTYGLVSSPYLAIRCLKQLAEDECQKYPLGAEILNNEVYMDDTISGGYTFDETLVKINQLQMICKSGGFELHKFLSNDTKLLENIDSSDRADSSATDFNDNFSLGVLGIQWNPTFDYFFFKISLVDFLTYDKPITKRVILSNISKVFDPLGWLSPVIIIAKIFMQKLWLEKVSWDSIVKPQLLNEWLSWYNNLKVLSSLKFNRWLNFNPGDIVEIHGFADASKLAYAAVVYLRIVKDNKTYISLIQSKTRVAPIKKLLTIPKLELSAVVLLAKLVNQINDKLKLDSFTCHLWTDSKDVLYWLSSHPSKWQTFIANRCSKTHELVPEAQWRHVRSADNPADCASRGLSASEFLNFDLWFRGPKWLRENDCSFELISEPNNVKVDSYVSNLYCHQSIVVKEPNEWDLIKKYSSLNKLLVVTAYVLRFISNLLIKIKSKLIQKSKLISNVWFNQKELILDESLTTFEINRARLSLIFLVQKEYYSYQFKSLIKNKHLDSSDSLLKLDPFIEDSLLRVGGRLHNSLINYDEKHPFILPYCSHLSMLLVANTHKVKTLHGGLKLTLATLRQQYWVVNGRNLVKKVIKSCITCIRYRGSTAYQKMSNLPHVRVQANVDAFSSSGVDYAGPFNIKTSKFRGVKSYKGYVALFICLSTRAVHLELVEGYDSAEFIAAFRRFTATRGECRELFSDQGTTFVGAAKEIANLFTKSSKFFEEVVFTLKFEGVRWHFNPPAAPNFGGIWEAAVKSTKHHLKRVMGDQKLTFNQFNTLLKQIEACLNSRPLLPLNDNIEDLEILTPFQLISKSNKPAYILPDPSYLHVKTPPLLMWRRIQHMLQRWWSQWLHEYLQSLQARNKWHIAQDNFKVGDIVLIFDNNLPPAKWPLAQVIEIYPAKDGLVRTVKLSTSKSILERPINKLIMLTNHD